MAYVDYREFSGFYCDNGISEAEYNRHAWEASRILENATTGADLVNKLREFFPTDESDVEAIKRCYTALIMELVKLDSLEKESEMSTGYITMPDGTVTPKMVASISSGAESRTFVTSTSNTIANNPRYAAVSDLKTRRAHLDGIVRKYLSGVKDANGVNVLYMGEYPDV